MNSTTPAQEELDSDEYDQKILALYKKFVLDFESITLEYSQKTSWIEPMEVRHMNVITFQYGWEEYMLRYWHKHPANEEKEETRCWQSRNLFMAGLEPFLLYLADETGNRKDSLRDRPRWIRKLRYFIYRCCKPAWFWNAVFDPDWPLGRWESMKVNLAHVLLDNIYYKHR